MSNKSAAFSEPRDVSIALNNATAAAFNLKDIRGATPERLKQLRAYLAAILDVVIDHRKTGEVSAEELVFELSAAALFIQVFFLDKTSSKKLSMFGDISKRMLEDQESVS